MTFLIADTLTDSLARLTGDEQKAAKTTAFDLQMNPSNPGLSFHRLDKARDKNFWSVRVNADLRLIVHRTPGSLLLCYVDHHDRAYDWAERRKLETHPKTGAAQLVEIRETVREIVVPVYKAPATSEHLAPPKAITRPFTAMPDGELLGYGVPPEWLNEVRWADEDTILILASHLPGEAAEALLEIATGGTPRVPPHASSETRLARGVQGLIAAPDPFAHPDAQRRFRVMSSVEELQRALDAPWEKWTVFLHPEQQEWVDRTYTGPARVSGSAGTGKTIVALHRAAHLARANPDARVLLATFSDPLAHALQTRLRRLVGNEPRVGERVEVYSLDALALRLHQPQLGPVTLASRDDVRELLREASATIAGHKFTLNFLVAEWEQIVDGWQIKSWEVYRDVARLGRKTRLPEPQRATLWKIFERVRTALAERRLMTTAGVFQAIAVALAGTRRAPYDFAVVDEAQDLSVTQLRFFAALGADRPNALFFAGDLGQRIFQQPFSWKALGVDIRGRSRTLRVNYRTSHQIRQQADRLLGPEISDVDGNRESRRDAVSVFNGPPPSVRTFATEQEEIDAVSDWLKGQISGGVRPHEIGIFVRSSSELPRAQAAADKAGLLVRALDDRRGFTDGAASSSGNVDTMHLAKGLEFRAVVVMACDDEVLPLQERIENVGDDADLQEVYDTERHLLYVACTRARDALMVTALEPASEFLGDLVRSDASTSRAAQSQLRTLHRDQPSTAESNKDSADFTRLFTRYLMVDWSASNSPKRGRDSIWIAVASDDAHIVDEANPATRKAASSFVLQKLIEFVQQGHRVLVGFDFPYGYPAGFAGAIGHGDRTWSSVWSRLAAEIRDDERNRNNRFDVAGQLNRECGLASGPFWGCPQNIASEWLSPKGPNRLGMPFRRLRHTESRLMQNGRRPQETWKLYTRGSVGSQALTGIPRLQFLRSHPQLSAVSQVWPFDTGFEFAHPFATGTQVTHVEIWPGVIDVAQEAGIPNDASQVRQVAAHFATLDSSASLGKLFERPEGLSELQVAECITEEGWILGA